MTTPTRRPRPGRQANGNGSVRQRKDGRWEARYTTARPGGGKMRKTFYAATEKEAWAKLRPKLVDRDLGMPEPTSQLTTLGQWLEAWIEQEAGRVQRGKLKPTTWFTETNRLRLNVIPALGSLRLTRLTYVELDALFDQLELEHSGAYARSSINVLKRALKEAKRQGYLVLNPADDMRYRQVEAGEHHGLSRDQLVAVLDVLKDAEDEALWLTLIFGGLRFGELAALRWPAVDFEASSIRVEMSLGRVSAATAERFGYAGPVIEQRPKTKRSVRTILMPDDVMTVLKRHKLADDGPDDGLVFHVRARGGKRRHSSLDPSHTRARWREIQDQAGVPADQQVRVHDIRRTMATLEARAQMSALTRDRFGWTAARMQDHYTDPDDQRPVVDFVYTLLKRSRAS